MAARDNQTEGPDGISVVIPLCNERGNLKPLWSSLEATMRSIGKPYEVIFVDDGSDDGSFTVLEELYEAHSKVKVIKFLRNLGKTMAYRAGFQEAIYSLIVTLDADLQDDPAAIPVLLNKLQQGYDLVIGWRTRRCEGSGKKLFSQIYNFLNSMLFGTKLHDHDCGLKILRGEVVGQIRLEKQYHRYIPVLAHAKGFKITEVPVTQRERHWGQTRYKWTRILRGFWDLLTVFYMVKFDQRLSCDDRDVIPNGVIEGVLEHKCHEKR